MKSLDTFASFEISNNESSNVEGGTFGLLSLFSCAPKPSCNPTPAPCYTPPAPSCNTGGYSNPCAPKPTYCKPTISFSFSFSFGGCK